MKKMILILLSVCVLASVSLALNDKYQIFSERKGWLGMGGRTIIMLDRETGDSWRYTEEKWVAIPKVTDEAAANEVVAAESVIKESDADKHARIEAEVNALKVKQEADIKALQAKQMEDVNSLVKKLNAKETPAQEASPSSIARPIRQSRPRAAAVVKKPAEQDDSNAGGDNLPPAWLTD